MSYIPWTKLRALTDEYLRDTKFAFAAIHELMRAGGLMVHQLPVCGSLSHGFFGYQPKFFHRLAKANDYEVAQLALLPQAEIDMPEEFRGDGLPSRVLAATLLVVMRRKDRRKFVMPADA